MSERFAKLKLLKEVREKLLEKRIINGVPESREITIYKNDFERVFIDAQKKVK